MTGAERLYTLQRRRLSLLAEGATSKADKDVSKGRPGSSAPRLSLGAELVELDKRWANCRTETDRLRVVEDATKTLTHYTTVVPLNARIANLRGTRTWKQHIAADPRPAGEVGKAWGVAKGKVLEYRKQFLADPPKRGRRAA